MTYGPDDKLPDLHLDPPDEPTGEPLCQGCGDVRDDHTKVSATMERVIYLCANAEKFDFWAGDEPRCRRCLMLESDHLPGGWCDDGFEFDAP